MSAGSLADLAIRLIHAANEEGRNSLREHEIYRLLEAGGLSTPAFAFLKRGADPRGLEAIGGEKVVVKVVSDEITHKTEAGGIRIVPNSPDEIAGAVSAMQESVEAHGGASLLDSVRGFLVVEMVESDQSLGSQVFCGMRFSEGIGHVVALGLGGVETEALAAAFREGEGMVLFSPDLSSPAEGVRKLERSYAGRLIGGKTREAKQRVPSAELEKVVSFFCRLAREVSNRLDTGLVITDVEVNPFLAAKGRLVPVDAVLRFSFETHQERTVDLERIGRLLRPRTAALMGVSATKTNIGRIILRNLVRDGFALDRMKVIRPGAEADEKIEGVECCPSVADLPWEADLMVVAVAAEAVPGVLEEVLETRKAAALVLIPGGMGETEAGKEHQRKVETALAEARDRGEPAPVLVGPNCLGIRSKPGRYDTLFIPESKLPLPTGKMGNVALVSQSGAFMITRMNRMEAFDPRYVISTGNQLDLSFTDFVEALLPDPEVRVIGVYIEGYRPMDGLRLARLIEEGWERGKEVVVYQAGRTSAGRTATSSHTASISGDYASSVAVLEDAGALVARTFEEFRVLLELGSMLSDKKVAGNRLGLVSNAGYETVGMADNIEEGRFSIAPLTPPTLDRLRGILEDHRLGSLVTARNPLDLTPMASDAAYEACIEAYLEDETVDALIVGAVPMTVALGTLPPGADPRGRDDASSPTSLPARLGRLARGTAKPMAAVVDAGALYDSMAGLMEEQGVPTFRSSDVAVRAMQHWLHHRTRER